MRLALSFQRVDPARGGAETYVADLCRALVGEGHRVDLYAETWREGVLPEEVRCVRVPVAGRTRWRRIWSFAVHSEAALRGEDYNCTVGFINTWAHDVLIPQGGVHAASLEANALRFPAGWRRGLYRLGKELNLSRSLLYRAIERRQYDPTRGARVVAVSETVRGHLERYHNVPRERITVIPNAIDAARLAVPDPAASRAAFRKAHGFAEADLVGLFVGHNFRLKGLPALLDALRLRKDRDPGARPIRLAVCGGGKVGPFRRRVEQFGLAADVRIIGFTPDIREGYHGCDFCVLPTYYDPCSLVVFEALACGLPVITTACNGAGELITPGREGFVIPRPDDLDALADTLDRMTDDAARRVMSSHAVALGREQSFGRHVARLLALFEAVASEKGRARGGPHFAGTPRSRPRPASES